jgi:predicted amidophosphoribosyltransferase
MSGRGDVVGDATHVAGVVPHWFLAGLALLPVARWTVGASRRWRRVRRTGKRLCWNCGYPLVHATDRCPECGEVVDAAG